MKKSLLMLMAAVFAASTFNALAHDDAQPLCYPLAHGENGLGSTNEFTLPHLETNGNWRAFIVMTNTSDKNINVKLRFTDYNGQNYTPSNYLLEGSFHTSNNPFEVNPYGAVLFPGKTSRSIIFDSGNTQALAGKVSWQADACIESALSVTVRSHYSESGKMASNIMPLNGGKPF